MKNYKEHSQIASLKLFNKLSLTQTFFVEVKWRVSALGKPKPLAYLVEHHIGIHLRSEGCNDPTKTPETCGIAYIYVDGIDSSPHLRGHNVVVLDAKTGNVFSRILHLGNLQTDIS